MPQTALMMYMSAAEAYAGSFFIFRKPGGRFWWPGRPPRTESNKQFTGLFAPWLNGLFAPWLPMAIAHTPLPWD